MDLVRARWLSIALLLGASLDCVVAWSALGATFSSLQLLAIGVGQLCLVGVQQLWLRRCSNLASRMPSRVPAYLSSVLVVPVTLLGLPSPTGLVAAVIIGSALGSGLIEIATQLRRAVAAPGESNPLLRDAAWRATGKVARWMVGLHLALLLAHGWDESMVAPSCGAAVWAVLAIAATARVRPATVVAPPDDGTVTSAAPRGPSQLGQLRTAELAAFASALLLLSLHQLLTWQCLSPPFSAGELALAGLIGLGGGYLVVDWSTKRLNDGQRLQRWLPFAVAFSLEPLARIVAGGSPPNPGSGIETAGQIVVGFFELAGAALMASAFSSWVVGALEAVHGGERSQAPAATRAARSAFFTGLLRFTLAVLAVNTGLWQLLGRLPDLIGLWLLFALWLAAALVAAFGSMANARQPR